MFASRHRVGGAVGAVDLAFTDRHGGVSPSPFDTLHLGGADGAANRRLVAAELGVADLVVMRQVHGRQVEVVDAGIADGPAGSAADPPTCDALVTAEPGVALCVRAADCVPLVLADPDAGVVGVVHAGRVGLAAGVTTAAVSAMRGLGAAHVTGWVGPHVCGGCYEVPAKLRAEVAGAVPAAYACTTWGTPSLDLGAGVTAQLRAAGCAVVDASVCTRESPDLYSYRRDGDAAGRHGAVVVVRPRDDDG
jgi:purine-nucleoside/S-methyl-5'-thioadenosine phosphorylase / adenosine deaminase